MTNISVVHPQIRYIEDFDITNPLFNEQICPVPNDFVKSRFHCISYTHFILFWSTSKIFESSMLGSYATNPVVIKQDA